MQTTGTRVPTLGFITGGTGQSDLGIPPQEYETFAYDSALLEAKIQNFNVVPYTSVLPKELYGRILNVEAVHDDFHHGAVLEVIMAGAGADHKDYAAIATGVGLCWAQNQEGNLIGGFAAEFIQRYTSWIDEEIARASAEMWLTKSMDHELAIRGLKKWDGREYEFHVNWLNLKQRFGYCLTALGFLNFTWLDPT